MSDESWRFGIDDVGPETSDAQNSEEKTEDEESGGVYDTPNNPFNSQKIVLVPLWAIALYAFTAYQSTLTALTALFGGVAPLAKVVASALALVGGVTASTFGLIVVLTVVLLLVGLYKRDVARIVVSAAIVGGFGILWWVANALFGHLPVVLVSGVAIRILGMYLSLVAIAFGAVLLIGAVFALAGAALI